MNFRGLATVIGRATRPLQRLRRLWFLLLGLAAGLLLFPVLAVLPVQAGAPQQDAEPELLENPGFEDGFYLWNGNNSLQVGTGWMPWWIDNPDHEPPFTRPEYRQVSGAEEPNRVHSGESAQQWFKLHSAYYAGVYQQAPEVTPQQAYRFSLWARVWSSDQDDPADVSSNPANPHLQIGIDPHGNVDPFSADIIWSFEAGMHEVIDGWSQLTVEAIARNSSITLFVRSRPEFANKHNNVFIDSASLQAITPATPTPTPTPTSTSTPTVEPPTVTPEATDTVAAATTATVTPTVVMTETTTAEQPTAAPATTIASTAAVTPTRPAPTDTPGAGENATQPLEPTAPAPTATETPGAPPSETPVAANTVTAPPATATVATATTTAPPTVTAAETAPPGETAVAIVSPTVEDEATARPAAPGNTDRRETPAGRGFLCAVPILTIGLFGLALVLVRRRYR
ncbi:MAG TPA: hypothetical protein VK879_11265 [Candidatus Sulfomarinibacteraceae bacterium]|nr:hypothetical protein [Candidatus Sulfomarinibacteraceae bacterium]